MVAPVSEVVDAVEKCSPPVNLSPNERMVSAAVGGALLAFGLKRLSLPLMLLTAVGGARSSLVP